MIIKNRNPRKITVIFAKVEEDNVILEQMEHTYGEDDRDGAKKLLEVLAILGAKGWVDSFTFNNQIIMKKVID